jgi:hypothetical protein
LYNFSKISAQALTASQIASSAQTSNFIVLLIQLYIIVEVVGSGTMMALIREGKINKSIMLKNTNKRCQRCLGLVV